MGCSLFLNTVHIDFSLQCASNPYSSLAQTHFLTDLPRGPAWWQLHKFLLNDYKAFKTDIERIWIWMTDLLLSMVLKWVTHMQWSHVIISDNTGCRLCQLLMLLVAVCLRSALFFLYFLLPLNVRTYKHPSNLLLVLISLVSLHVSVCVTGWGVSTLVQDMNTLAGEDSGSLLQGSKAEPRKIKEKFKITRTQREREQKQIYTLYGKHHRCWKALTTLRMDTEPI